MLYAKRKNMDDPPYIQEMVRRIEESVTREYHNSIKLAVQRKFDEADAYRIMYKETVRNGPYMWITVNAKDSVDPEDLLKACRKAFTKSWCKHSIWALEQRAEEPPYKGYHVHGVIYKGDKPPYDAKRGCKSTLKKVCNVDNGHCLYIRYLELDDAKEKVMYLLGNKRDQKMSKVEADKKMRENLSIPPYFVHNWDSQNLLESQ